MKKMTNDLESVFDYIEKNRQAFMDRLFDYLRMASISAYGEGIEEVADYLVKWLEEIGLNVELVATPGYPVVVARNHKQPGKPTLLIYGHYDVQPPDPLEAWVSPPFEPTIRNGRIYARGVGDNKGQHFANLLGIETLLKCSGSLPCNVTIVLEGEEEIGSPHMAGFVNDHLDLLRSDLAIVSDGPVDESGRWRLEFGVRGIVSFELRARGANRDVHSGNWGGVVPNPLWTLVHLLATMKNERGEITIDGIYEHVLPQNELEREAVAQMPIDVEKIKEELELVYLDEPVERPYYDRLGFYPTLTINGMHGGYAGPGSKTVLPHEAFAKCDIRLVSEQTTEEIFKKVEAHVRRYAPEVKVIRQGGMEPSKTPLDSPFAEPIFQAMTLAQGEPPLRVPAMGGSLPNYIFTKIMGIPAFVVPYANADEANHAPNENMEVERFYKGIRTSAAILTFLGRDTSQEN
jgi:acetylornithine deacetylase/succinyl-diaminopimelate desuccinylase-like protein